MSSLFKPSSNTRFRVALGALALLVGGGLVAGPMIYVRTPFYTQQQDPIEQPVQFDHRHHVGDEGIDCHRAPEKFLRPRAEVTNMTWKPKDKEQLEIGRALKEQYHVQTRISCTTCHR